MQYSFRSAWLCSSIRYMVMVLLVPIRCGRDKRTLQSSSLVLDEPKPLLFHYDSNFTSLCGRDKRCDEQSALIDVRVLVCCLRNRSEWLRTWPSLVKNNTNMFVISDGRCCYGWFQYCGGRVLPEDECALTDPVLNRLNQFETAAVSGQKTDPWSYCDVGFL